jgi:hypothetical protein
MKRGKFCNPCFFRSTQLYDSIQMFNKCYFPMLKCVHDVMLADRWTFFDRVDYNSIIK